MVHRHKGVPAEEKLAEHRVHFEVDEKLAELLEEEDDTPDRERKPKPFYEKFDFMHQSRG